MIPSLLRAFEGSAAGFMVVITALGALCAAVLVERLLMLWRWRIDEAALLAELSAGALPAALARADQHPARALIRAGAEAPNADAAWDAIAAQAALVEPGVRGRLSALAAAGNIATMLGLLGTVYGLIVAFAGLGDTSSTERAVRLSEGISTAMNTTAYGLLVGIPALAAHAGLDGALRRVLTTCEAAASTLLAWRRGAGAA